MRCNYFHIWFIYSCRERPSIHFTLEKSNSHFDLKCNFWQSWSQQFGLNMAQACARWTKGWEGEQRDGEGQGRPCSCPSSLTKVQETIQSLCPLCPKHDVRPVLPPLLPNTWPALTAALTIPTLKTSLGFTNISQVFKKFLRVIVSL